MERTMNNGERGAWLVLITLIGIIFMGVGLIVFWFLVTELERFQEAQAKLIRELTTQWLEEQEK